MSLIGLLSKQPSERVQAGINYLCWLREKANMLSIDVAVDPIHSGDDPSLLTVFGGYISPNGKVVHFVVEGGTSVRDYRLTIRAQSTLGLIKEDEMIIRVEER